VKESRAFMSQMLIPWLKISKMPKNAFCQKAPGANGLSYTKSPEKVVPLILSEKQNSHFCGIKELI